MTTKAPLLPETSPRGGGGIFSLASSPSEDAAEQQKASLPLASRRPSVKRRRGAAAALLRRANGKGTAWRPAVQLHENATLGTFRGVFVPCMLSIIGVVLFLRLGWAVGQAGVLGVLAMFALGGTMALLTDLSLSAMATNGKISAGGTYYLISRSVGPELGGAIGVMFYLANTLGIAFYLQGFTDTVADLVGFDTDPNAYWMKVGVGVCVLVVECTISVVGSSLYSRSAFYLFVTQMLAVALGTISLFGRAPCTPPVGWRPVDEPLNGTGCFNWFDDKASPNAQSPGASYQYFAYGPSAATLRKNLWPDFDEGVTFQKVFGIIFPAMTGIMAGTNMSGVLKRPELSIPRGELSALACCLLTYSVVVLALGSAVPRDTLKDEYLVLTKVSYWPWGVTIGILVSTTSSALASIQSAARILQALALDGVVPPLARFARTYRGEPALGIIVSAALAFAVLLVGSLDAIAPVLTMFFLVTYATTNFATFVHSIAGHPNFRPRFRWFSWRSAALGFLFCVGLAVYLQYVASAVACMLMLALICYISKRAPRVGWGDVTQSLIFHQVRKYLLRLDEAKAHVKFWRPQLLAIVRAQPRGRANALEFLNNLKKGGLYVLGTVLEYGGPESSATKGDDNSGTGASAVAAHARATSSLDRFVEAAGLKAFVQVVSAPSLRHGLAVLLQATGLGGMRPNTVCLFFHGELSEESGAAARREDAVCNSVSCKRAAGGDDEPFRRLVATTEPAAQGLSPSEQQQQQHLSAADFALALQDVRMFGRHLLLLRNFHKLDKAALLRRARNSEANGSGAGPSKPRETDGLEAGRSHVTDPPHGHPRPPWAESIFPDPRAERHTEARWASIDVWQLPPAWSAGESGAEGSTAKSDKSFSLALQLAATLRRHDFWQQHTYLRVCGVVANEKEADGGTLAATHSMYGKLHQSVIRDDRIRAAVHVFVMALDSPVLYREAMRKVEAAKAAKSAHAAEHGDGGKQNEQLQDDDEDPASDGMGALGAALGREAREELFFRFMGEQRAGAVMTFVPLPALPKVDVDGGTSVAGAAARAAAAEQRAAWVEHVRALTANHGPTVFVQAVDDVISVEL